MLGALGYIYGKVAKSRNSLYEKGFFRTHDLGARTISIGNITAGGTGKTPLVGLVASLLAARGESVCILTRGYGRKNPKSRVLVSDGNSVLVGADEGGDEPVELALNLLGKAVVVADADRVAAAAWARERFRVTAFVLDDGFQHRRARRDVDIVCIDATDPFGGDAMLPAGRLREPVANLARADAVIITRADQVNNLADLRSRISNLKSKVSDNSGGLPVFAATNKILRIVALGGGAGGDANGLPQPPQKAFAFCGIGNPENFFDGLRKYGIELAGTRTFRDHHRYSQADVAELEKAAAGADVLITTGKDAVKLREMRFSISCYVAEIGVQLDDPDGFERLLTGVPA